ncbi:MAG: cell division protein FtsZ, partial [Firmicutes bacterium]|nr:cell division protein FtsZ [Bacillota bacterium]
LVVVPNDRLLQVSETNTSMLDAFKMADDVLKNGVEGISSLISEDGLINLDFADVKTVMTDKGIAHMGIGRASGEGRVEQAIKMAVDSPLLETSIKGAKAVLLNIMGGYDLGMLEVSGASDAIAREVAEDAFIIFGTSVREDLHDEIRVTVIATGFEDMDQQGKGLAEPVAEAPAAAAPAVEDAPAVEAEPIPATTETTNFPIPDFLKQKNNFKF